MREESQTPENAYMTVEASFLLPMVLCVIVVLIYTSFFLYDRCLLGQDAYILCMRESYRKDEDLHRGPDAGQVQANAERQMGSKYFAVTEFCGCASADGKIVRYTGSASTLPQVFGEYFLMPKGIWNIQFGMSAKQSDPPLAIRSYRRKKAILQGVLSAVSD